MQCLHPLGRCGHLPSPAGPCGGCGSGCVPAQTLLVLLPCAQPAVAGLGGSRVWWHLPASHLLSPQPDRHTLGTPGGCCPLQRALLQCPFPGRAEPALPAVPRLWGGDRQATRVLLFPFSLLRVPEPRCDRGSLHCAWLGPAAPWVALSRQAGQVTEF